MRQALYIWLFFGTPAVTLILCCAYCSGWILWEYLHNPNRYLYEIAIMAPLLSIVSFVLASIAEVIAYLVLPLYVLMLLYFFGRVSLVLLIPVTPLLGLLGWFGYEHFVPNYRFYTDQSPPYEYGLTIERFLVGWALEVLIVFFYWWPFRNVRLSSSPISQADAVR
jgi:hypothetical protein